MEKENPDQSLNESEAPTAELKPEDSTPQPEEDQEFTCTPYEFANTSGKAVDYNKLIKHFGTKAVTPDMLDDFKRITGEEPHIHLRRGVFFSHRDFNLFLKQFEEKKPLYLYTGRGPSSDAMHLGHLLPFIFTSYLQRVFKCPLVIQLTDDEKFFLQKPDEKKDIEEYRQLGYKNAKDIIACGFDKERTFIFSDMDYIGQMYPNVCRFQKLLTYSQCKGIFGLKSDDNCGRSAFPAIQAVPCFSNTFPQIFGEEKNVLCLIPQGIDQDPYFRMTRDVAERMKMKKPCCIHSKFLPGLHGFGTKMSSSDPTSAIFLTDTPAQIKNKINKYAFSGGQETAALQREKGANLDVDVPYNYLTFLLEDDEKLAEIGEQYATGKLLTGEVKAILIEEVQRIVKQHQDTKAKITDEEVKEYMTPRPLKLFNDGIIPGKPEKQDQKDVAKEPKQKVAKAKSEGPAKKDKSKKSELKPEESGEILPSEDTQEKQTTQTEPTLDTATSQ